MALNELQVTLVTRACANGVTLLAIPFALAALGHLAAGVFAMIALVALGGLARLWNAQRAIAWTHTDEYRQDRLRAWILKDLPSPCETLGHEYILDPEECYWCGKSRARIRMELSQRSTHAGKTLAGDVGHAVHSKYGPYTPEEKEARLRAFQRHLAERQAAAGWIARPTPPATGAGEARPYRGGSGVKLTPAEMRKLIERYR